MESYCENDFYIGFRVHAMQQWFTGKWAGFDTSLFRFLTIYMQGMLYIKGSCSVQLLYRRVLFSVNWVAWGNIFEIIQNISLLKNEGGLLKYLSYKCFVSGSVAASALSLSMFWHNNKKISTNLHAKFRTILEVHNLWSDSGQISLYQSTCR